MKGCLTSLPVQILIGIVAGILLGVFAHESVGYVSWIGTLFLRLLTMLVIPLVFFLVVDALGKESARTAGRLGVKAFTFYTVTTVLAVFCGLVFVSLLKPGVGVDLGLARDIPPELLENSDQSLSDILMNIVPSNVFAAMAGGKILPVLFFAILVGVALSSLRRNGAETLGRFFSEAARVMMRLTEWVIRLAPLGVFAMIADRIGSFEGDAAQLAAAAKSLGLFTLTVAVGLSFHLFVTMSILLLIFGVSPRKHLKNMVTPLLTAFSTASSNATIPVTIAALEEKSKVRNEIAGFVVPLGATVNMDGTALYEGVVALFIAQSCGVELTFAQMGLILFTALISAVGTAGIPMASLVMISIVLNAVGLPLEGMGLILIVDRFLDMLRTAVNVYGDSCCAVVIARTEQRT